MWSTGDIAQHVDVGPEQARRIVNRPDFPPPLFRHGVARFWDIEAVKAWAIEHPRKKRPAAPDEGE